MMGMSAWATDVTVTYTVNSKTSVTVSGTAPTGSAATFENTGSNGNDQMTAGVTETLTLTGFDGLKIKGLKLSMKSNSKGGAGNMYMKIGATTVASIGTESSGIAFNNEAWNGSYTTSYVDKVISISETTVGTEESIVVFIKASVNSLYCRSFTITYESEGGDEPEIPSTSTKFNKVTNKKELVAGNEYIIVSGDAAMGKISSTSTTYGFSVSVTNTSNSVTVSSTDDVVVLTLGGSADAWTFQSSDNSEYIAWSSGNSLKTLDATTSNNAKWIVTDDFQLKNKADDSRVLQFNSGSPRFACYTSGQTAAYLYVKEGSSVGKNVADVAISTTALFVDGTATVTTDGPAVTLSTSDASVASVSGTTVTAEGAGTATITATWDESAEFQAGSEEFTITVLRVDGLSSAKAFTVAEAKAMIDNGYDSEATYYVDGIISKIDSYNDSHHSITYWISKDGSTTDQFECYGGLSFDGEGFTGKDNLTVGDEVTVKGKLNKYGSTYELNSNNELVYLRSTISVSESGYATYYNSGLAYVIPTGLTGYAITAAAGDQLTTTEYTAGFGVPAGEALVLKGAQGNYDLIFTTTDVAPNASNLLKGSDAAETPTADGKYYMLSYDETGANVGFYWGEDNGAAFENGAHKAYLLLPADTPVKGFRFDFDEATAITELTEKTEATEEVIYNLQGQQLSAPQRGINIIGGKKVLVK